MGVPLGSAGGSAQDFFSIELPESAFWNVRSSWVRRRLCPKFFSSGLPENAFCNVRSSWVRRRLCPKFFRSSFQKMLSGMFVPLGSAGGSAQNFFVRASRKCFLECSFLLGPPEALPKIFSSRLPENAFWNVRSSWVRRRLCPKFFRP